MLKKFIFILLILIIQLAKSDAFRIQTFQRQLTMKTSTSLPNKLIAVIIGASLSFQDITFAAIPTNNPAPQFLNLETAIENFEKASDRGALVQSLADLYESSGSKTLLARSKYKYVS